LEILQVLAERALLLTLLEPASIMAVAAAVLDRLMVLEE
jgi:hypothetical protein